MILTFAYPNFAKNQVMKRGLAAICLMWILSCAQETKAQCSICAKTAQQLGEKPAKALNGGIIYLASAPLLIIGYLGFRWYRANRDLF